MVPEFCAEALRLAEKLTAHRMTASGEAHALAALICFHHARAAARSGPEGDLILLAHQDRSLWDRSLIARGTAHLQAAMEGDVLTPIHLEAAIAAIHATAPGYAATDWAALKHFYTMLVELKPTPIVRLNAAIACAEAEGAEAGLAHLDALLEARRLAGYALYHAARGELLIRLDRRAEAAAAFTAALACPANDAERQHLARRLAACR
jgi:RNA polymerase sigma-70 factor (ECF subfamily)